MAQEEHCNSNNYNNNNATNNDKNNTNVGVKFSLQQAMKAQGGRTNIDYFYTSLTLQQEKGLGVVNDTPRSPYPRKRFQISILQEAGWAPWTVWANTKNLADTGLRTLDRKHRS